MLIEILHGTQDRSSCPLFKQSDEKIHLQEVESMMSRADDEVIAVASISAPFYDEVFEIGTQIKF
jgi:hypothetical protein